MTTGVRTSYPMKNVVRADWTGLAAGETGDPAVLDQRRVNLVVQASGTFNTETLTVEGSLDGTTWFGLTEDGTAAISFTADGIANVYEHVGYIRPVVSAGAGVTINVRVEAIAYD